MELRLVWKRNSNGMEGKEKNNKTEEPVCHRWRIILEESEGKVEYVSDMVLMGLNEVVKCE